MLFSNNRYTKLRWSAVRQYTVGYPSDSLASCLFIKCNSAQLDAFA